MLTLAASQDALSKRADVVPARLFHLTTYADRERGTVDREFWWSLGAPWLYEWNGGVYREFDDLVLEASPFEYAMEHLPAPGRADTRRTTMRLQLSAENVDGEPLWKTLFADPLTFARLEVATLLIEPERLVPATAWWDLRDLPGTEHVVRFRGEFTAVDEVSDDGIVLLFEGEEPNVDWPEALDDTQVDPKDLGRRYAIPFGNAKSVPCINRNVGWNTTLAAPLTPSQTGNVDVTSAAGLPGTGSFTLQIGSERVTATKVDADTVNISARAVSGSIATSHQVGESILEVQSSIVVVVAGVPCKALDALYVINPATREKVRVTTGFTTSLDNTAIDAGRRLTTATFTQAQFEDLLDNLAAASTDNYERLAFNKYQVEAFTGWSDATFITDSAGVRLNGRATSGAGGKALFTIDAAAIPTALLGRPISRIRAIARLNGEGDTADGPTNQDAKTKLAGDVLFPGWEDFSGTPIDHTENADYTFQAGTQENGVVVASPWWAPTVIGGKTGSDLDEVQVRFYFDAPHATPNQYLSDNWAFVFGDTVELEVEFGPSPLSSLGAAAFGWGLQFVADVQGVMVPDSFKTGYGFDEGTGWSLDGGATQTDLTTAQRISTTLALIADTGGAADNAALWTGVDATLANETTLKTQGTGSVKITPTASGNVARADRTLSATADWTKFFLVVDVYPTGANHLNASDGVRLRVDDTGGDFKRWNFGTGDGLVLNQWNTIILDFASTADNSSGTLNLDAIAVLEIVGNGRQNSTSNILYFDNIRLLSKTAAAQRNSTSATVDLTTGISTLYRTRIKATNVSRISTLKLYFSNTAGTGTTLPAAYRTITFQPYELVEGQWVYIDRPGSDTGSPSLNSVETVRVEINHTGAGLETPTVEMDNVAGANATNADWDGATAGTLLTAGPDAIRYFIGELAGVGAANVLGVATAKTNLGSSVFAGNFCALGTDFATVLARLAFETRTNVVRREGASSAQYQLHNASAAYAFPAASLTLEELSGLRERMRAAQEVATHFRFHYGVELADAQLATNEAAFRALLRADPSVNDLTTPATATLAAAAAVLGRRDSGPIYQLFVQDEASAKDVAGYYAAETVAYARRRWTLSAPLWEAYAVEPGDVVALTPRWASGAVKARVVGVTVDLAQPVIGLALEEVN